MTIHDSFIQEHLRLRKQGDALESAIQQASPRLPELYAAFREAVLAHFKKKDVYYARLDEGKRVQDRALMHDLRNDHAAVVFTLESLSIRLRKNGLNDEWKKKWAAMVEVLWPHWQKEERELFPLGQALISPSDLKHLENEIQKLP